MDTLSEEHFRNDNVAGAYLEGLRWRDGPICAHCGSVNHANAIQPTGTYRCAEPECRKNFTVTLNTPMGRAPGGQFVLHAKALPGYPYDGHTLKAVIENTERLTGCEIECAYVDKGYRGHDTANLRRVFISAQRRGVFGVIQRELRPRSAIEAVIGHLKTDGHLGRCYLKGREGDAANAILTAVGHNLRLVVAWLRLLLRLILIALLQALAIQPVLKSAC